MARMDCLHINTAAMEELLQINATLNHKKNSEQTIRCHRVIKSKFGSTAMIKQQ